jgi:hypothetical protein
MLLRTYFKQNGLLQKRKLVPMAEYTRLLGKGLIVTLSLPVLELMAAFFACGRYPRQAAAGNALCAGSGDQR